MWGGWLKQSRGEVTIKRALRELRSQGAGRVNIHVDGDVVQENRGRHEVEEGQKQEVMAFHT